MKKSLLRPNRSASHPKNSAPTTAPQRYARRLARMAAILERWSGVAFPLPAGGFYLWAEAGDAWGFTERLAAEGGALVSPGDFYGARGARHVRVAVVQPDDRIEAMGRRLGVS